MYDILIIGGGPAGLTAALYARRAGRSVAVLERAAVGGQILNSPLVENYPGLPQVAGADFAAALQEQTEALGAEIFYEEAEAAERTDSGFLVRTDAGEREARALILAIGAQHRMLGLPGEEELTGRGVSYCAVCDGAFYAGRNVAVVGGGDTALQDALFLSGTSAHVTLLVRRDRFRGEAARADALRRRENVEIRFLTTVEALRSDENGLTGLTLRDRSSGAQSELGVDGLFLAVGQRPDSGPFSALAATDAQGYFSAGEDMLTATPGLFVAGDCRSKTVRQLTTAVGDGAAAAIAACAWLDHG